MRCDIVNLAVRAISLTAAITCLSTASAWLEPARAQTPAAKPQAAAAPTAAAKPGTPGATPAAAATPQTSAASDGARRSACEHYVAVLSGREKDANALNNPALQALAGEMPDLATCGAVASDSDALCKLITGADPNSPCRKKWSTFHELRANPKGRGYVYPEAQYEKCRTEMPPSICEKFRAAAQSGDAKKCEGDWTADVPKGKGPPGAEQKSPQELSNMFATFCRALVSLDKAQCGKLKEANVVQECEKQIGESEAFAKGLKTIAESGPPSERNLAKAALGQGDACKSYAQAAMEKCEKLFPGAAPPTPQAAPAAPAATPKGAPSSPGPTAARG